MMPYSLKQISEINKLKNVFSNWKKLTSYFLLMGFLYIGSDHKKDLELTRSNNQALVDMKTDKVGNLRSAYAELYNQNIRYVGNENQLVVINNSPPAEFNNQPVVVSEGYGYHKRIAVSAGDKFNFLNSRQSFNRFMGLDKQYQGLHRWVVNTDGSAFDPIETNGRYENVATDAEFDSIVADVLAEKKWGQNRGWISLKPEIIQSLKTLSQHALFDMGSFTILKPFLRDDRDGLINPGYVGLNDLDLIIEYLQGSGEKDLASRYQRLRDTQYQILVQFFSNKNVHFEFSGAVPDWCMVRLVDGALHLDAPVSKDGEKFSANQGRESLRVLYRMVNFVKQNPNDALAQMVRKKFTADFELYDYDGRRFYMSSTPYLIKALQGQTMEMDEIALAMGDEYFENVLKALVVFESDVSLNFTQAVLPGYTRLTLHKPLRDFSETQTDQSKIDVNAREKWKSNNDLLSHYLYANSLLAATDYVHAQREFLSLITGVLENEKLKISLSDSNALQEYLKNSPERFSFEKQKGFLKITFVGALQESEKKRLQELVLADIQIQAIEQLFKESQKTRLTDKQQNILEHAFEKYIALFVLQGHGDKLIAEFSRMADVSGHLWIWELYLAQLRLLNNYEPDWFRAQKSLGKIDKKLSLHFESIKAKYEFIARIKLNQGITAQDLEKLGQTIPELEMKARGYQHLARLARNNSEKNEAAKYQTKAIAAFSQVIAAEQGSSSNWASVFELNQETARDVLTMNYRREAEKPSSLLKQEKINLIKEWFITLLESDHESDRLLANQFYGRLVSDQLFTSQPEVIDQVLDIISKENSVDTSVKKNLTAEIQLIMADKLGSAGLHAQTWKILLELDKKYRRTDLVDIASNEKVALNRQFDGERERLYLYEVSKRVIRMSVKQGKNPQERQAFMLRWIYSQYAALLGKRSHYGRISWADFVKNSKAKNLSFDIQDPGLKVFDNRLENPASQKDLEKMYEIDIQRFYYAITDLLYAFDRDVAENRDIYLPVLEALENQNNLILANQPYNPILKILALKISYKKLELQNSFEYLDLLAEVKEHKREYEPIYIPDSSRRVIQKNFQDLMDTQYRLRDFSRFFELFVEYSNFQANGMSVLNDSRWDHYLNLVKNAQKLKSYQEEPDLKLSPSQQRLLDYLDAIMASKRNQTGQALSILQNLDQETYFVNPGDEMPGWVRINIAGLYVRQGNLAMAQKYLAKVVQDYPLVKDPNEFGNMARTYVEISRFANRRSQGIDPEAQRIKNMLLRRGDN